ncbi:MAG TPA: RNA chaperone Hfq [bacterium]|nr:RNA chaperone Hfq [bacterium]
MASEIFAEDIEALLGRLEGVASARVVANDAGQVERIYVTAAADRDETALRRMVGAALMSQYSLAVDGWRVRIARLRPQHDAPAGRWELSRMEELLSPTTSRLTVQLRADNSRGRGLTGSAEGPTDQANRRKAAALATLDALKSVFEAEGWKPSIETITSVPLGDGDAVVVGISLSSPVDSQLYVGTAVSEGNEAEAVIAATLEAIGKRTVQSDEGGWTMKDRRDQLEAMRAHYRSRREVQRELPVLSETERSEPELEEDEHPPEEGTARLAQIRPERPGGAAVEGRSEPGRGGDQRSAPKGAMEDEYFRHLIATSIPIHIRCRDGYEITEAVLKEFGTYTLLVETDDGRELIFKHAVISIHPMRLKE